MGLFDGVLKKEKDKPKKAVPVKEVSPSAKKKEEPSQVHREVAIIPLEEDTLAREIVKPQVRYVKKVVVTSYSDLEKISEELQNGNLVLVDLSPLELKPDILEKVAEQIKGMTTALGGQLAKVCKDEIKLLLVPEDIRFAK
ncbi:cell division protein SepF [Thermococcus waiotapuensis]|uniref:Cell division protein SepF n=1 Tax=Thermococcus waiotapuensis TaxID=90909 RepID=A0AAE4NTW8_9EURY|nr:cell division protein SepF [Thermococcus waiotapuensis]MDV3103024.1 cell division protein SepF [Thermococcus waiotapuensis]